MANADIRAYAKQSGVFLWEIANYFKCSEPTITRKLRQELSADEKKRFTVAIKEIEKRKEDV